jgi:hypothetical protein
MPTVDNTTNIAPASKLVSITKSDSTVYSPLIRAIYVGVGGDINVVDNDGNTVLFVGVPQGSLLGPFALTKVMSTNTNAGSMIGFV